MTQRPPKHNGTLHEQRSYLPLSGVRITLSTPNAIRDCVNESLAGLQPRYNLGHPAPNTALCATYSMQRRVGLDDLG
jgi:hypothetical protein